MVSRGGESGDHEAGSRIPSGGNGIGVPHAAETAIGDGGLGDANGGVTHRLRDNGLEIAIKGSPADGRCTSGLNAEMIIYKGTVEHLVGAGGGTGESVGKGVERDAPSGDERAAVLQSVTDRGPAGVQGTDVIDVGFGEGRPGSDIDERETAGTRKGQPGQAHGRPRASDGEEGMIGGVDGDIPATIDQHRLIRGARAHQGDLGDGRVEVDGVAQSAQVPP